ncbi:MAG: 3-hydroxyacyl-ACP dehydratase FabZ [Simkaniaceae bacterium]|nr:3-hydroxyacyl-ACP dehydratase FabZ [Simkaniaceae bacterium]
MHKPVMTIKEIAKILPHAYPFLLVDRILEMDLEKGIIVGQKNVTMNENFFPGHFPDAPLMPGVLILEAMAQTGGILIHKKGYDDKIAVLMTVNNAKFRRPVLPGDVLMMHIEGKHFTGRGGRVQAKALVNEKLVAEAEIGFGMTTKEQL